MGNGDNEAVRKLLVVQVHQQRSTPISLRLREKGGLKAISARHIGQETFTIGDDWRKRMCVVT